MHFSCRFEFSIFTHFNWNLPLLLFVSGFNFFYSSWAKDWNPIKVHWLVIIPLASKIVGYFNSFSLFAYLGIIVLLKPFHLNRKNRAFLFGTFKNPLLTKTTWNEISKALCSLLQQKKRKKKSTLWSDPSHYALDYEISLAFSIGTWGTFDLKNYRQLERLHLMPSGNIPSFCHYFEMIFD